MSGAFDPESVDILPEVVPIFPLAGATLLPGTVLPLNIFEPRYLNMVFDALASHRYVAMVQPSEESQDAQVPDTGGPSVYDVGCAGRITAFNETEDGRILISLKGTCRLRIAEEIDLHNGYRRVRADWRSFAADLREAGDFQLDRERFRSALSGYFDAAGLKVDWDGLDAMPDARMVDFLAMNLPFSAQEKQALLEAPDVARRNEVLMAVAEMATRTASGDAPDTRH